MPCAGADRFDQRLRQRRPVDGVCAPVGPAAVVVGEAVPRVPAPTSCTAVPSARAGRGSGGQRRDRAADEERRLRVEEVRILLAGVAPVGFSVTPLCSSIDLRAQEPGRDRRPRRRRAAAARTRCLSAIPFSASFTVCDSGLPPADSVSPSVTSTIRPRRARIISGATCFAVKMCETIACRARRRRARDRSSRTIPTGASSGPRRRRCRRAMSRRPCSRSMRATSASTSASIV